MEILSRLYQISWKLGFALAVIWETPRRCKAYTYGRNIINVGLSSIIKQKDYAEIISLFQVVPS